MSSQERLDQAIIDAYIMFHAINGSSLSEQVVAALKIEYEKKLQEIEHLENILMGGQ